ncbi:MAG TPA: XRE family transcriptional regulator [Tissierellaceae bacterium]
MNFKQLIFAREFRGLTQTELSKEIKGLSQSNLSKFEKGLSTLSDKLQNDIIEYLGFPKEFYNERVYNVIEGSNYRKKSVVSKADIISFEQKCKLVGYLIDSMADSLEWPEFRLVPLNVEDGFSPKKIADHTRKLLKLKSDEPVRNIISLLESSGVIVYEIDAIDKFDGISFTTEGGFPVIIVNASFPNDRKRFTIAHELGHILMHDERNFLISEFRNEKIKEAEANAFASEFLLPENEIRNSLYGLSLKDLGVLKKYWLTSMGAILRRAYDLKCIDEKKYKYFNIELSRLGYRKNEPIEVFIDKPKVFEKGYNLYKDELNYSMDDLVQAFKLPKEIIDDVFGSKESNKIRVLNRISVLN